jgi:hypothetical protein
MARQQPIEIFTPPNLLKAKVGGTFNMLDSAALKRAEQAVDGLKGEFSNWINADVQRLGECRDVFAKAPGKDTQSSLYRASHDLKGQALTFEYPWAARVAASLCKLLDEGNAASALHLVDAHVSAIRVIVRDNVKDQSNGTAALLTTELEARVIETLAQQRKG